ncbi:MAG: phosphoenolpyruvate carboxykinase (ATP), partial [Alphaproteobacteria bacterium]|nr:phosphoenolpyruvate carboxykinase (ATP) [Alphaproteobacteria bacterium]
RHRQTHGGLQPQDAERRPIELEHLLLAGVRRVVGRDAVERAVGETGHDRLDVLGRAQRRAHLEVGVESTQALVGEGEVVGTGFGRDPRPTGLGGTPKNIIMLTCDAFGVLPPVSKLTAEQAMYHFLSGYTARVAGTERGVTEPQATFSTCFGAPFMPRPPGVYAKLLGEKIAYHKVQCWLVNTGWTGGAHGQGQRMPIHVTRALVRAILDGTLAKVDFADDGVFGLSVPKAFEGVSENLLHPRQSWADKAAYDKQAAHVAKLFADNFKKYEAQVTDAVKAAAMRGV